MSSARFNVVGAAGEFHHGTGLQRLKRAVALGHRTGER